MTRPSRLAASGSRATSSEAGPLGMADVQQVTQPLAVVKASGRSDGDSAVLMRAQRRIGRGGAAYAKGDRSIRPARLVCSTMAGMRREHGRHRFSGRRTAEAAADDCRHVGLSILWICSKPAAGGRRYVPAPPFGQIVQVTANLASVKRSVPQTTRVTSCIWAPGWKTTLLAAGSIRENAQALKSPVSTSVS